MKPQLILLAFLFVIIGAKAQETKINGSVVDVNDKQPIPFANITFKGTTVGTISTEQGTFFLSTRLHVDTLLVSYLGYESQKIPIKKGIYQTIKIELHQSNISLGEVTVVPGENPAHVILKKIIANRDLNNPERIEKYHCKVYNKMQIDVNNLSEDFKKQKLLKKFDFVFDYMDTSEVSGKNFLPVLISETFSDFYYRRSPKSQKEIILANKVSGIEDNSITQYTGQMYQKINIYDNYVNIIDRSIVSPISSLGRAYYKYYLLDSAWIGQNWCYQISFVPRFKSEPTFDGFMWVADTSFAIKTIELSLSKDANLNLVQHFYLRQDHEKLSDNSWLVTNEKMVIDFNLAKKTMGLFVRKSTKITEVNLDSSLNDSIFSTLNTMLTVATDTAKNVSEEQWNQIRPEALNKHEAGIYAMVDSVKNVPIFQTYYDVLRTVFAGYYQIGKIEIGDYSSLYSYNEQEGHRVKLALRTSRKFSRKLFLDGYLAYGFGDERVKYGIGARYHFTTKYYRTIGLQLVDDLEQIGSSPYGLASDNLLNSLFSRTGPVNLLTNLKSIKVFGRYEWFQGFTNSLTLGYKEMKPYPGQGLDFRPIDQMDKENRLLISEITIGTRIAFNERTIEGREEKKFVTSKYPVININYTFAPKGAFYSNYDFKRFQVSWLQIVKINPLGYLRAYAEFGKILGTVPYPLLEIHKGNETYWYDDYSFNLMNYYEFMSDEWFSLLVAHHFEGFFLNKIPLMKKLEWREVVTFKGVVGNLTDENKAYSVFPIMTHELNQPYMEASLGVENIFKIVRVDALWRLTHLEQPNINKIGIRVKMQFEF